ncbi:MAG: bifunctional DNA-formamidopyrimidine glycosylase/DNA-(apurinic or apyrimidinic site) lyase [Trueperaceae bacterium]
MPELPEVETVRRELEPWLVGRKILKAERVDAPEGKKYANLERAAGQKILAVNRLGKFLILPLGADDELIIHLGMTGIISAKPFEKHVRAKLTLNKGKDAALYFQDVRRFGRFLVVEAGNYKTLPTLDALGPEPLTDLFNEMQFARALQKSSVAIKTYLLSQKPVSGVGNIYADEALWQTSIHPLTPANKIPKQKILPLVEAIKKILAASIEAQGTTLNDYRTVNGEVGEYLAQLKAYGHEHEPCERCGTPISRIVIAGRSSHYCSRCQKLKSKKT